MFWFAILAGLAVSVPPGPLGALCVVRTLRGGMLAGLAVGLAVAVVDGFVFGSIAALGSHAVGGLDPWIRRSAAGVVAVALFLMGLRAFRRAGAEPPEEEEKGGVRGRYGPAAGALLLALGTPGTLPALLAIFASAGIDDVRAGALGVFVGGFAWWSTLCGIGYLLRERIARAMRALDYACGALLWLGAAAAGQFAVLS